MELASTGNQELTAKDAREVAGVTYRQISDWSTKGAVGATRSGESGWRKFSPRGFFVLLVCAEIRKQFGAPIESLKFVSTVMLTEPANHLKWAEKTIMDYECSIYLLTDLKETFVMGVDYEIAGMLDDGELRGPSSKGFVLLHINPLVDRLREAVGLVPLVTSDFLYRQIREGEERHFMLRHGCEGITDAERELLRLIREKGDQELVVHVSGGQITRMDIDEELQPSTRASARKAFLKTFAGGGYGSFTMRMRADEVVGLNRRTTIKLDETQEDPDSRDKPCVPVIVVHRRGENPTDGPESATGREESADALPGGMSKGSGT